MNPVHLVLFLGGMGGSPVEDMLAAALREAALDSVDQVLATGAYAGVVVVTDRSDLEAALPAGVSVDLDGGGEFHFGRRLREVLERYRIERFVYVGAGSVPLMDETDFAAIAADVTGGEVAITNNFFSADVVAAPAAALRRIEAPAHDNILPRLLRDAGVDVRSLPRTDATQFNLDSPADLAILAVSRRGGPRLRAFVDSLGQDLERHRRCMAPLVDRTAEVLVAGRIGSHAWQYLERETACRVRVFSEERGMRAAGRDQDGSARSLLAYHARAVGLRRLFEEMAEMADAAFIDSRVLLAHAASTASRRDRFLSDLGDWAQVDDCYLRELTREAGAAPLPVLLGGHSLVSGGLMALTEAAWREHDLAQA